MPLLRPLIRAFLLLPLLATGLAAQTLNLGGSGGALGLLREAGVTFREATGIQVVVMPPGRAAGAGGRQDRPRRHRP